jgi:hypothetical protein
MYAHKEGITIPFFQAFADMVEGVYGGEGWVRLPDPPPPSSSQPLHTTAGLLDKSLQKLESFIKIKQNFKNSFFLLIKKRKRLLSRYSKLNP